MILSEEQEKIMAILEQLCRYNQQLANCGADSVRDMEALARSLRSRMGELEHLQFAPRGANSVDPEALNAFTAKLADLREQVRECMNHLAVQKEEARGRMRSSSRRRKLFNAYGGQPAAKNPSFHKEIN